jgi:hypothetical protein
MLQKLVACLVAVLLVACLGIQTAHQDDIQRSVEPTPQASQDVSRPSSQSRTTVRGLGAGRQDCVYAGHGDLDRYLGRYAVMSGPPYGVRLASTEKNPSTQATERSSKEYSVSFDVRSVRSITANDFLVFGYGRGYELVFERWTLPCQDGEYCTTRELPGTPVGVPAPKGNTVLSIAGGVYVPVAQRPLLQPLPTREEVYRGTALQAVASWDVDPEGRFLFVGSSADQVLLRIDLLDTQASPVVVYTGVALPILAELTDVTAVQHLAMGRGWILRGSSGDQVYLWDFDNDGLIDSSEPLSAQESAAAYPFSSFAVPIP